MADLAVRFLPPQYKTESLPQITSGQESEVVVSNDMGQHSSVHSSMIGFNSGGQGNKGIIRPINNLKRIEENRSSPKKRVSLPPKVQGSTMNVVQSKKEILPVKKTQSNVWSKAKGLCHLLTPFTGIAMALCQCMCVAFSSLLISSVRSVSPLQITTVRMLMQLLLSLPPLIFAANPLIPCKDPLARRLLVPLYVRCIAGTIGVTCLTFSMVLAPIADASTISYTSPIYVAVLARIFLKEAIALPDAGLLFLALVGVIFVTRPAFIFPPGPVNDATLELLGGGGSGPGSTATLLYPHRVLGLCFAVASSILTAIAMVTIRKINKLPFATVLVNFSLVGTVGTAILCAALGHYACPTCTGSERFYIVGAAVLGTAGQFFLFCALRLENAGVVAAINSVTIVFTILLQIWFVHKVPPWTSWLGSGIIIVAIVCFGYRKWLKEKEKDRIRGYPRKRTLSLSIPRISSAALINGGGAAAGGLSKRADSSLLGQRTSVISAYAGPGLGIGSSTDTLTRKRRISHQSSLGGTGALAGGHELLGVTADSFMIYEVEENEENEEEEGDAELDMEFGTGGELYDGSQDIDTPLTRPPTGSSSYGYEPLLPETPDDQQLTTNTLIVPSY